MLLLTIVHENINHKEKTNCFIIKQTAVQVVEKNYLTIIVVKFHEDV